MVHFVATLRVKLLLWALLIASTRSEKVKGLLPDVGAISSYLGEFIKPYIESLRMTDVKAKTPPETKIERVIRLKVNALKPKLQDNENNRRNVESDNNLTLEGNDETTIIEFMPKANNKKRKHKLLLREINPETDSFQKIINKYKKLRQTIKTLLDKENTTSSTKKLIIRTLDEMIAQLIESQCTWKSVDPNDIKNYLFEKNKNASSTLNKLHKLSQPEWTSLRKQYLNFLKSKDTPEDTFLKQFHDIFSRVINETWYLANRYKIRCQLVKVEDSDFPPSRQFLRESQLMKKDHCDGFKICSDELKEFLNNFYSYLNNTAVSTFRNYAAMYVRDVNSEDSSEQDTVVTVLENLGNAAEKKVTKIFKKQVHKFTLDENKENGENIQHITDFITSIVEKVKKVLKKILDLELDAMKTKTFATVKEDLIVNLRVDMDNMARLYIDKICDLFVTCNGKVASRRHSEPWPYKPLKPDDLYVKVQLTLDDELKNSIVQVGYQKPWPGKDLTYRFVKDSFNNVSATRTTIGPITYTTTARADTTSAITRLPVTEVEALRRTAPDIINNDI